MSRFVEVEWFGRSAKIGIVLTYDEHDGFKSRMAPLPYVNELGQNLNSEQGDIDWLMANAAKIPFEWAWGIFGERMKAEWMFEHMADSDYSVVRYDGQNYNVNTLERVK